MLYIYIFLPRFLRSIQECIRKMFLTSDAYVGNGVIAIGLTTPSIPFVRELKHESASLRVCCIRMGRVLFRRLI